MTNTSLFLLPTQGLSLFDNDHRLGPSATLPYTTTTASCCDVHPRPLDIADYDSHQNIPQQRHIQTPQHQLLLQHTPLHLSYLERHQQQQQRQQRYCSVSPIGHHETGASSMICEGISGVIDSPLRCGAGLTSPLSPTQIRANQSIASVAPPSPSLADSNHGTPMARRGTAALTPDSASAAAAAVAANNLQLMMSPEAADPRHPQSPFLTWKNSRSYQNTMLHIRSQRKQVDPHRLQCGTQNIW